MQISAPKSTEKALEKLLDRMYISNVSKRLRELNQPNDIDRKRWIWELLQNAKDTIANNPNRDSVNARILIDGDIVKFQHNGDPFTADARLGLLYKYSDDKENSESTGRFGTGFLTTHCLSKVVTIESNMEGDEDSIIGFSVTMYRDGFTEQELLEGLDKMRASEHYYDIPYEWTTYTYHINSESGRRAVQLGKENFKENIAQTLLFCKELSSVELIDKGEKTSIERISDIAITGELHQAQFKIITGDTEPIIRTFIYHSTKEFDEEISAKYKANRSIRLQVACEVDNNNNIVGTEDKTSLFCVFPLVGIEGQIQMPIFVNSPDFEPDSERQSLILNGITRDEERSVITEVGINQKILCKLPGIFNIIIEYLSRKGFNSFFNLCNGLKSVKSHEKLDKDWYKESIILALREKLTSYPIAAPLSTSETFLSLTDCVFIKENSPEAEETLFNLLTSVFPEKLVADNSKWAHILWKDDKIKLWSTDDVCSEFEAKGSMDSLNVVSDIDKYVWYDSFIAFVLSQNEILFKEHALLPNMKGKFLKRDTDGFKQSDGVTSVVLDILAKLDGDMKPLLLHESITSISLDSKFNSISYSAKVNSLAKNIIDTSTYDTATKLRKLQPLISITVSDINKYEQEFIIKRSRIFTITKELFQWSDIQAITDNSLNKAAWEETDKWLINHIISTIELKKTLANLPIGLGAKWLNDMIHSLGITLATLDNKAIVPNQNGEFRLSKDLFIDNGVPEILKNDVFKKIGLYYKDFLLDNDIDLKPLGKTSAKNISDFATDLSTEIRGYQNWNSSASYNSYGAYRKYSEEVLRQVALYLIQVLPKTSSENASIFNTQKALLGIACFFLPISPIKCEYIEERIDVVDNKLWLQINDFICYDIISIIEKKQNITNILTERSTTYDKLFEYLNTLYRYIENGNIQSSKRSIYPNQAGCFISKDKLYNESESIDKTLKDIIALISDEENNYYNILIDPRCVSTISNQKSTLDAYTYIDGKVKELYSSNSNWENEDFKKAATLLIDEWGEVNKNLFDENHFPKVYPIKDSVCMNVIWTKNERQQLQTLKNSLNEKELTELVTNIDDFKDLSNRNKELEEENIRLKQELERLKSQRKLGINYEEEDDASKQQKYQAQLEAQLKLIEERPDWIFPKGFGECNENGIPYCYSTIEVQNEFGETIKIVLKSYKIETEPFKVNPTEWEWVVKGNAKLLVYRYTNEIVEVPKDNLVKKQSKFSITFDSENLNIEEHEDRLNSFSSLLKYFNEMHFNFASFRIPGEAKSVKNIYAQNQGVQNQYSEEEAL